MIKCNLGIPATLCISDFRIVFGVYHSLHDGDYDKAYPR